MPERSNHMEPSNHRVEAVVYSMVAILALGLLSYLCYFNPVIYTRMVNEDQWGEYGTAVGFGMAGGGLLLLCAKAGPLPRRLLWAVVGLFALGIAGEELSWGQRILNFASPATFQNMNTQGEFNLHNFGAVDTLLNRTGLLRQIASLLIIGWAGFCWLVSTGKSRLGERLEDYGLPVIPLRLLPLFLLVPFFFMVKPLARSDEIGELLLAVATTAWVADLWLRRGLPAPPRNGRRVLFVLGVLLCGAVLSAGLTRKFPGSLKGSLNYMAQSTYPGRGMYAQADQIYRYIYANPHLLKPDTRIRHARMLLALGQEESAKSVLRDALEEMSHGPAHKEKASDFLRRQGVVHALLGETEAANGYFAESIALERREAEQAPTPDEKAELLWSVAQTLEAQGARTEALETAHLARDLCLSAHTKRKLTEWIQFLVDPVAAQEEKEL